MKRVLSISTLYPNAAGPRFGTFVARSLEALASRGDWHVTMINPIGIPPVAFGRYRALAKAAVSGTEQGVEVHRPRFTLIPRLGARINPGLIARAIMPLAERLHREQPFDLVDAQFFYPDGPVAAHVARRLGLPFSIKARGSDITYWGGRDFAAEQMLAAADSATGLLSVSQALARDMALLGMDPGKIAIHYTGLDRDRFRPLDHAGLRSRINQTFGIALPETEPVLASVGALVERKGQNLAIGALVQIPGAHLVLVGKGDDETHLRSLADDLGLRARVHFLGSLDHDVLPLVLSASDAMVLPTRTEGLANAWVEALACGTPLVTCDVGGVRELVTGPEAGVLVERTVPAIVAGINTVLARKTPRTTVAQAVARFDWKTNAADLAAYYRRLIARVS
ncbi:MAG: glycosyltransferase [Sphingomonadaceae bacterium]